MHPYLRELLELDLTIGDWALFGSGPLLVRGWIDNVGDLDIIARDAAWESAQTVGTENVLGDGTVIFEIGAGITVGRNWAYGDFSIDELIDTAEIIGGVPCVLLEHVIAYKKLADRPKDRLHLALIGERNE
ncbi:MAG: hypothetical protein V3U46_10820 [Acidimicrobiia bacterium]